jgi:hypothetical protein
MAAASELAERVAMDVPARALRRALSEGVSAQPFRISARTLSDIPPPEADFPIRLSGDFCPHAASDSIKATAAIVILLFMFFSVVIRTD